MNHLLLTICLFTGISFFGLSQDSAETNKSSRSLDSLEELYVLHKVDNIEKLFVIKELVVARQYVKQGEGVEELILEGLRIAKDLKLKCQNAPLYISYTELKLNQGNMDEAINLNLKAIENAESCGEKLILANSYSTMSIALDLSGNYSRSRFFSRKALTLFKELKKIELIAYSYNDLGVSFDYEEKYDSALWAFDQGLALNQFYTKHILLAGKGNTLRDLQHYDEAFLALVDSYKFYTEINPDHYKDHIYGFVLSEIAVILAEKKSLTDEQEQWVLEYGGLQLLYEDALAIADQLQTFELITKIRPLLAQVYSENGEFEKAFEQLEKLREIEKEQNDVNQQRFIVEYEAKFKKIEQDKKILKQKKDLANSKRWTNGLYAGIGFLVLLLIGIIISRKRIKNARVAVQQQKALVDKSLKEKDILLKEVHHRVKNNLQVISSLLNQQAMKSSDKVLRDLVNDGQRRIKSMAMIHQKLYQTEDFRNINMETYAKELTTSIARALQSKDTDVEVLYDVDNESFNIDTAISLGLILNELITNAYKYAFKGKNKGQILIALKRVEKNQFELTVKDDGIGLPSDFEERSEKSLGITLVKGIGWQLRGALDYSSNNGSMFTVKFNSEIAA